MTTRFKRIVAALLAAALPLTSLHADVGSFWRIYFCVEDCDATVDRVKELGGALLDGPIDAPFGRIATLADPTGASFQVSAVSQAVPEGGAS